MNYFIYDLDNCFADDSWRAPRIDWHLHGDARYRRYNEVCHDDPACHLDKFFLMAKIAAPVFFTGRSEEFRPQTLRWLKKCLGVTEPELYMRPLNLKATPSELKEGMLAIHLRKMDDLDSIIAGFDDLPEVTEMYCTYGIPGIVLKIHDLDLYTPPKAELS